MNELGSFNFFVAFSTQGYKVFWIICQSLIREKSPFYFVMNVKAFSSKLVFGFPAIYAFIFVSFYYFFSNPIPFRAIISTGVFFFHAFVLTLFGAVFSARFVCPMRLRQKLFTTNKTNRRSFCSSAFYLTRFTTILSFAKNNVYSFYKKNLIANFTGFFYHFHNKELHLFRVCRYLGDIETNGARFILSQHPLLYRLDTGIIS